ncbi:MAG: hypothetical protein ACLRWP_06905 [Bilophila wadsworthia]
METAKQLPGMPTGDAPGGDFVDDSLPAPDFSGWGDEDGKKKKGKKGKGAGPVTVVSLDSGSKFSTVFIPAASKKDKDASKPVGTSVLLPSSSGDSETVAFSRSRAEPRRRPEQDLRPPAQTLRRLALEGERAGHTPGCRQHPGVFIIPSARPRAIFHPSSGRTAVDRRSPC